MLTVREGFYDEMLTADGTPRPYAETLVDALQQLGPDALAQAGRRRDAIFMQQGITFDAAHGIRPPGGVYTHVSGCDLVRDGDGSWKVLEDNVRTPSGISYVLENRADLKASVKMTRSDPSPARA